MCQMIGFGEECVVCLTILSCLILMGTLYMLHEVFSSSGESSSTSSFLPSNRVRTERVECCICLENVSFAVETSCGHVYCGACLVEYINRSTSLSTSTCPYCRQGFTMILFYFTPEESQNSLPEPENKRREVLIERVKSYNRFYSNVPRSLLEHIRDFPILASRLWNMLWDYPDRSTLFSRFRIMTLFTMALVFFLNRFDIIPEFVFRVFGPLSDAFIFLFGGFYAVNLYRNLVALRG